MTVAGTPSIYYGDEQAFTGIKEERVGGDDAIRPALPDSPAELAPWGRPVLRAHQDLIGLRRRNPWLVDARTTLVSALSGKPDPLVGLLNIGEEAIKGSEEIKRAGELLRQAAQTGVINFYGNVEGNDTFKGTTDIVVCDGFVGNVALKTTEGLASMIAGFLREEFSRNLLTKLAALAAMPVLGALKKRIDPRRHNGAALLGLRGLVFKSHGGADEFAFCCAMTRAYDAGRQIGRASCRERV